MNRCILTRIILCVLLLVVCCGKEKEDTAETIDSSAVDGGSPDGNTIEPDEPAYQPGDLHDGQMELPLPTGPYRIGLSERLMTPGIAAPNETDAPIDPYTPYFTRIFFPVDPAHTGETLRIDSRLFNSIMIRALNTCGTSDQVLTHTYQNAEMVSGKNRFPVVLFAPGAGSPIDLYLSILEDLASHGYIVVAFQPEGTFAHVMTSDSSSIIVDSMVADAVHTLDHLDKLDTQDPAGIVTSRLDLEKVGMFGHSIGGATAREACVTDPRFKACGNLDGAFYGEHFDSPLARPLMIQFTRDHYNTDTTLQTVWDVQDASAYRIAISDIAHLSFMDCYAIDHHFVWSDEPAGDDECVSTKMEPLATQGITKEDYIKSYMGTLDPVRAIDISRAYTRAFFDKHLKGIDQDLLKGPSEEYPEVTFEAKNPQ